MVKKIRLIDDAEATSDEELEDVAMANTREYQELVKSMDWKLWEILQILQRFEKKLTVEEKDEKNKK